MPTLEYNNILIEMHKFIQMKKKCSEMTCECWGIYYLDEYDDDYTQGTYYTHLEDFATEQECIDYVKENRKAEMTYIVLPVIRDGCNQIFVNKKNATWHFKNYVGPCKILFPTSVYKTIDCRSKWFEGSRLTAGIESTPGEVIITDKKPENWDYNDYNKDQLRPVWPSR